MEIEIFATMLEDTIRKINTESHRCRRCFMDTTAQGIVFDEKGICNYCTDYLSRIERPRRRLQLSLEELVERIKVEGQGKPYDCVVGVSGGVDSSFALVKARELGLRPLAVHMDNGWDSEMAANNIKRLVAALGVDLYTHVIDWEEYRSLMQAFFDADVIDVELLYDNAMLAVCYQQAAKWGVKYILTGSNTATEGMPLPPNWNWFKLDKRNIKALARRGGGKIQTFPAIGVVEFVYYEVIRRVRWIPFLDYFPAYDKNEALEMLMERFHFKPYPYKHYESIFTRFYQGFILPVKFGVDKRKNHLSTLVLSEQMSRDEAEQLLQTIPYPSRWELLKDIEYFLKKMGWTTEELYGYLQRPEQPHAMYGTEKPLWDLLRKIYYKVLKQRIP